MTMLRAGGLLLAAVALLATAPADAAGPTRHSGTLVAIDPERGVLVLDEVGPSRNDRPVITRRTVVLTPSTTFNTFIRVNVPDAFAGQFLEVALDAGDLTPGDFVTAECLLERGRLVAQRVTLAEQVQLPSSPGAIRP